MGDSGYASLCFVEPYTCSPYNPSTTYGAPPPITRNARNDKNPWSTQYRNDKTHEIANARNAMTKYLKLRSYFVVLFAQNVHGAMILIFEIAKAKNTIFAIAKRTRRNDNYCN